jgi:Tol biopolymer transport system component
MQLTPFDWNVGVKNDWFPDSSRIMFITDVDGAVNTLTIKPNGTDLTHVTDYPPGGTRAYGNTYSPNGRWILMRLEVGDEYALYTVHPDGRHLRELTAFTSLRPRGMAWGTSDG